MAYSSKEWRVEREDGTIATRSNTWSPPGSHPVGYGVKVITNKEGELLWVEGDDENPVTNGRVNAMNLALREYTYSDDRIIYPMKRAVEDRGYDKWERISWDQAIDEIIAEVRRVQETYGKEGIVMFGGTGRQACQYSFGFCFSGLESPNYCYTQSGWSCYGPRCSVADYIVGAGYPEMDYAGHLPDRYDDPRYIVPKWIVLWGKEPLPSNGDGLFGHALVDLLKLGAHLISFDPRVTWVGSRPGNIILQLRPQTDAALGLAIANLMIENDEYDHDFVDNWVYGWDEFKARCAEYPVDKVAEITGVDPEDMKRVAHILGTERPISWCWGLAMDQNKNGVQVAQLMMIMAAMTGSMDRPGGITLGPPTALVGKWRMEQRAAQPDELWSKRIGAAEWPGLSTGMTTTQPDATLDTMETDQPYPLRLGWFTHTNFLAPTCSAQPKRWHKALMKLECTVFVEIVMTPTCMAVGDYFLPLTTWAEQDGMVLPHYGRNTVFIAPINKALYIGECHSDLEIDLMFGGLLNPDWWPWYKPQNGKSYDKDACYEAVKKFYDDQLREVGLGFTSLKERGIYQPGETGYEYEKWAKGLLRFDGEPGFNTITGQIEAYSILYESWGEDPLPYFEEPNFSPISKPEFAGQYPLFATSGSRKYSSFHSENRHVPSLRQIDPWPWVEINPETAAEYGVTDGDWVEVYNMYGEARFKVQVTPIIKPGIINCAHGWWFPEQDGEEPNLYGVWKSNFNSLIPHFQVGKLGFGAPYKGIMCNIRRVLSLDAD
jgi:anaerobic selenocysteine-containing dehydrogenase